MRDARCDKIRTIVFLFLVLSATAAFAGPTETVLVAPTGSLQAGQSATFSVYVHNFSAQAVRVRLPNVVVCRLKSPEGTVEAQARSLSPTAPTMVILEAKSFLKREYSLTVPRRLQGTVSLEVPTLGGAAVLLAVAAPPPSPPPRKTTAGSSKTPSPPSFESLFSLYQPYLRNLTAYQPMYFLVGTEPEKSKFQISFKYRLLNPRGPLAQKHPWVKGFHLAYTQTSFWDLKSASKPFKDTSYKPEFFFQSPNLQVGLSGINGLFLQTGFQHESNGRGGADSRSTNFLYLQPTFILFNPNSRFGFQLSTRVWRYVSNDDHTNPDLADYRGYFDVDLKLGSADGFVLGSNLRWARRGGSVQLDLTYPLHHFSFDNFDLYFQAQYVNSLAESLLHYRDRTKALRLGFAIVR